MSDVLLLSGLESKELRLREIVRGLESCVVAFSGGVDSALVLAVAQAELGARAVGVTGRSQSLAQGEEEGATAFARDLGARHEIVATHELEDPNYRANPQNRCYYCKTELYDRLHEIARERGLRWVVDGFNADDESDYRPGRLAAREREVRSPLAEAGFTKDEVRALARKLELELWEKPALACLSSRFPYGTEISLELLRQVDRAERAVRAQGVRACRVRHHGEVARIEVPQAEIARLAEPGVRERITEGVRAAGYRYVALDLGGYVTGNLNVGEAGARKDV